VISSIPVHGVQARSARCAGCGAGKTALLGYAVETAPDFRVARAEGVESEMVVLGLLAEVATSQPLLCLIDDADADAEAKSASDQRVPVGQRTVRGEVHRDPVGLNTVTGIGVADAGNLGNCRRAHPWPPVK